MSQFTLPDLDADLESGTELASDLVNWRNALHTSHKGAAAPTYAVVGMRWLDDSNASYWCLKQYDGTNWQILGFVETSTGNWLPPMGGGSASLGSGTTTDLWSLPHSTIVVTGNVTIAALATSTAIVGTMKNVVLTGAPLLTHNATSLILPGAVSRQGAIGDTFQVVALGSSNVRVIGYSPANGKALVVDQQIPTGTVIPGLWASAPTGTVDMNGGTIGDASSGSSLRANADTSALFAVLWALDATVVDVLTSGGVIVARGASAAADFAAHRRVEVPDFRGLDMRGLDLGRGFDVGRLLGSYQPDALLTHDHAGTFTGNALGTHKHSTTRPFSHGASGNTANRGYWSDGDTGGGSWANDTSLVSAGTPTGSIDIGNNSGGAAENRVKTGAVRIVIKL